jgi:hypothetical protein
MLCVCVWRSLLTFHEYVHISDGDGAAAAWICIRGQILCTHTCARPELHWARRRSIVRQCIRSVHCRLLYGWQAAMTLQTDRTRALSCLLRLCLWHRSAARVGPQYNIYSISMCALFWGRVQSASHTSHAQKPIVDTTMWVNAETAAGARDEMHGHWRALSPSSANMHAVDRCMYIERERERIMQRCEVKLVHV